MQFWHLRHHKGRATESVMRGSSGKIMRGSAAWASSECECTEWVRLSRTRAGAKDHWILERFTPWSEGPATKGSTLERTWCHSVSLHHLQTLPAKWRRKKEKEEKENRVEEDNDEFGNACDLGQFWADGIQWLVPYRAEMCKLVEGLADELPCACQTFCKRIFKPHLQPDIRMTCAYEGWSVWEDDVTYCLLVPLQPPPGYDSCVELDTTKEMLTNASCLHVQLKCMYKREQMMEDMVCLLHYRKDDLESQHPSLLDTLCTNSYLDIQKTACWFQMLVKNTQMFMPLSQCCQLKMLTCCCKLQLTNTSKQTLSFEMILGSS